MLKPSSRRKESRGMKWEKRVRFLSWVCFFLMWVAVIWYMTVSHGYEGIDDPRILPFFAFLGLFLVLQLGAISIDRLEKESIRRDGIEARATIISYESTGRLIRNKPELKIALDVQPPYEKRFTTTIEQIVPYGDLHNVQPGIVVRVFYQPGTTRVTLADL